MPEPLPPLHDAEPTSSAEVLLRMIDGYRLTQLLYVAAKLGIADLLHDGPKSSQELAQATQTHPRALYRVLRALASLGVFAEDQAQRFQLTPLAHLLRTAVPGSLRARAIFYGEEWIWHAEGALLYSVQTGQAAFAHVHGIGPFDYYRQHAEAAACFNASNSLAALRMTSDEGEACWVCAVQKRSYTPSTIASTPFFVSVRPTLLNTSKACAPAAVFEHCDTFRAITAGRSARAARLLVGSTGGACKNRRKCPRS